MIKNLHEAESYHANKNYCINVAQRYRNDFQHIPCRQRSQHNVFYLCASVSLQFKLPA